MGAAQNGKSLASRFSDNFGSSVQYSMIDSKLNILTWIKSLVGYRSIVDLLIEKGAQINTSNNRGDTVLMLAALNGDLNYFCFD